MNVHRKIENEEFGSMGSNALRQETFCVGKTVCDYIILCTVIFSPIKLMGCNFVPNPRYLSAITITTCPYGPVTFLGARALYHLIWAVALSVLVTSASRIQAALTMPVHLMTR